MRLFPKLLLLCLVPAAIGFPHPGEVFAVSDSANINLQIAPENACNNNRICEISRGETEQNCPQDCIVAGGGPLAFRINNVIVGNVLVSSADISWLTTQLALCEVFWGKTAEYSQETIAETDYEAEHLVKLGNLEPSTLYHFKITCADRSNKKDATSDIQFYTLFPLENVYNLTAFGYDKKVILQWTNPSDENFNQVKIVRNDNFYPLNMNSGVVIYDGFEEYFIDTGLTNQKRYYYAIFAGYKDNSYSSGSLASAVPNAKGEIVLPPVIPVAPPAAPATPAAQEIKKLKFEEFDFFSQGIKLPVKNNKTVRIENKKPIVVSIDYAKLPKSAETIIIDVIEKEKTYSYLFRARKEQTFDLSLLAPKEPGNYPVKIILLNNKNEKIQEITGEFAVFEKAAAHVLQTDRIIIIENIVLIILTILLLAIWFLIRTRRRREQAIQNILNA